MIINIPRLAIVGFLSLLALTNVANAQRGRGGMVGGNRGGGGGEGGGGARPNVSRPPEPARRPEGNPNINRPAENRRPEGNPNINRPEPARRPEGNPNINRPEPARRPEGNPNINRPAENRQPEFNPNINRPGENRRPEGNPNFNRPGENRRPEGNPNFNRPGENRRPEFNPNINRPNNINENFNRVNINRENFVNNNYSRINNNNNINNFSRGGYNAYGFGHGGGNPGWGGYGGYGSGYHANSYYGYHSNWVNGSFGQNFYPGWGGGYGGYGGGGNYYGNYFGYNPLALGAGLGIASWGVGSLANRWGYSSYSNPYYSSYYGQQNAGFVAQPVSSYDYSRPLDLTSQPPPEDIIQTSEASLETARQAFRAGDYNQALALSDQALAKTPNDPMLHEFRATCLFAMGRYDEAAIPLYTVLSSGPGWDWTTLIGLYPDVEVYTTQLRSLEAYCNQNPRAASARFVLASLYLTQGSNAAAANRFGEVVSIQPQDKLSAQLLGALNASSQANPANNTAPAPPNEFVPANPTPTSSNAPTGPPLPTGPVPANLVGSWNASPAKDVMISLTLGDDKSFTWKVVEKGQTREFKGEASFDNEILALVSNDQPPMVAKVNFNDPAHFHFKAVATPNEDPGLDFGR